MRYGSVSSGIECAAIAWAPLGWEPAFLAEIDPFASTVLHHHHSCGRPKHMPSPDEYGLTDAVRKERRAAIKAVSSLPADANGPPNHGDMTTFEEWPDATIDLLIGGTPCQTYSVAGLREGLDDPRGDLTLTYAAIARKFRPRWMVWENVFGVLSHDGGRSFGSLLGLLSGRRVETPKGGWKSSGIIEGYERAYGLAWRVLDTQYIRIDGFGRAIPQRRRRVFVVGYLGDWRRAAAVLLERESMSGNPPPIREAGKVVAGTIDDGAHPGSYNGQDAYNDKLIAAFGGNNCSGPITAAARLAAHGGPAGRMDFASETFLVANPLRAQAQHSHRLDSDNVVIARTARDVADTLTSNGDAHSGFREAAGLVAHTLRGRDGGATAEIGDDSAFTLRASSGGGDKPHVLVPKAFNWQSGGDCRGLNLTDVTSTLTREQTPAMVHGWAVRRLTTKECCRLQGVPDDYFDEVVWRGKSPPPDGPIYKTLGNGFSANAVRWIGRRIEMVEQIIKVSAA